MLFEQFQDGHYGGHLGYQNRTILAILNLHVALMPSTKFGLISTALGDVVWRFPRWLPWQPSWISEGKDFSNSEPPSIPNASTQVSTQSDLRFWRRCWKCWKLTTDKGQRTDNRSWHKQTWSKAPGEVTIEDCQDGCRNKILSGILNLHVSPKPPTKFGLNLTYHFCLFVLRFYGPVNQINGVMSSAVTLPKHSFTGQA